MYGGVPRSGEGWCPLPPPAVLRLSVATLVPRGSSALAACSWRGVACHARPAPGNGPPGRAGPRG
eukprot:986553-Alexandrium_andersonii.AAC.1